MISIKSQYEVELMRKANQIVKDALNLIEDNIKVISFMVSSVIWISTSAFSFWS